MCYMNVIVQLLYGLKCMRNHILESNTTSNDTITLALRRLFEKMRYEKGVSSAIEFKRTITRHSLFSEFNNDNQHDSHQFLISILHSLSKEDETDQHRSVLSYFRSTLVSVIECQSCQTFSANNCDHSTSIELGVSGKTLSECLSHFFGMEVLQQGWHCPKCNCNQRAHKHLFLKERPILIITMKRFNDMSQKLSTNVTFPLDDLLVPNLVDHNLNLLDNKHWKLFGVVNHLGINTSSGHYTLYMTHNNKWFKYDDEKVAEIRKDRVNSSNAYSLIYITKDKFDEIG